MLTLREKYICVINNDMIVPSDAIILLEGDGVNRVSTAATLYLQGMASIIVFSGGAVNYEYGSYPKEHIIPKLLDAGVKESHIIVDDKSMQTKAQAKEIVSLAKQKNWKRIILVASPDHQYRAYLTFLRIILDNYPSLIMINAPAKNLSWFDDMGWKSQYNRLDQEFERIDKYSAKGDLANYQEAIEYHKWKEQQLKRQV